VAFKLGMHAKMYYASTPIADGSGASSASWTEQTNVKDLTLNLETGEADATTRGNNGWRATLATLKEGSMEFEMVWDTDDAGFTAIKDAWLNSTEIALAAMDGDIDTGGSQGLASNFTVTNFSRNEPLEEAITVNVTVKPSSQTEWYEVSGV